MQDDEDLLGRSHYMWQLEECSPVTGSAAHGLSGSVTQWSKSYRIRHTMSLKYLKVGDPIPADDGFNYFQAELVALATTDPADLSRTIFNLVKTESQSEQDFVERDNFNFRIRHEFEPETAPIGSNGQAIGDCWLHQLRQDHGDEVVFKELGGTEDAFVAMPANESDASPG